MLTETGYLKRMPVNEFEATSRGTRGKAGTKSQGEEAVRLFISCNDHDSLLLFSDRGVVYSVPAYRVPMCSRAAKGTPIVQLLPIPREEQITSLLAVSAFEEDGVLVMLTSGGYVKRTRLSAFSNIRSNGLIAISLEEGDALTWVRLALPGDSVWTITLDQSTRRVWTIVTTISNVNETNPIRSAAGTSCDNVTESSFPSVYGKPHDVLLLSQSFDDTASRDDFVAPPGTYILGRTISRDEFGILFGKELLSVGPTGKYITGGKGGSKCKDALLSIVVNRSL